MTPAEELRAAVKALRCPHTFDVFSAANTAPDCGRCGIPYGRFRQMISDDLAVPLAAWLEWAACQADMNVGRAPRHRCDLADALAVARVINGGAS